MIRLVRAFSIFFVFLSVFSFAHAAGTFRGEVVRVVDGDTMDVSIPERKRKVRIRFYGIDYPERDQRFESRAGISCLLRGGSERQAPDDHSCRPVV